LGANFLAEKMRAVLGQPVNHRERCGSRRSLGVGRAVRQPPMANTLMHRHLDHAYADGAGLYALQFDLLKDLEPVIQIGSEPLFDRRQKNSLPADDLKGLIAYLKANPDKASVGIAGGRRDRSSDRHFVPEGNRNQVSIRAVSRQCTGHAGICWRNRIDFMIEPSSNFKSLVRRRKRQALRHHRQERGCPSSPDIPNCGRGRVLPRFLCLALVRNFGVAQGIRPKDIVAKLKCHPWCRCWPIPRWQKKRLDETWHPDHAPLPSNRPEALRGFQKAEGGAVGGRSSRPSNLKTE